MEPTPGHRTQAQQKPVDPDAELRRRVIRDWVLLVLFLAAVAVLSIAYVSRHGPSPEETTIQPSSVIPAHTASSTLD